jgi:hypothetical protein
MTSNFASMLKAKAERIQAERTDKPINGKTYALTGPNSIASGKSWAQAEVKDAPKIGRAEDDKAPDYTIDGKRFEAYRSKVDELLEALQCPIADLAIIAVESLYREVIEGK